MPDRTIVQFHLADDNSLFCQLPRSQTFTLRKFPSPTHYREEVERLRAQPSAPSHEQLCALAQRDWHVRGQTGCMFARLAARAAHDLRWDYLVLASNERPDATDMRAAVADPQCQVLSLLFPEITSAVASVAVITELADVSGFWLERDETSCGLRRMRLRYAVARGVAAWIMAFGPLDFLPNTRKAPYFELAIRVKAKEGQLFHRLNQDPHAAHLADVPLKMSDEFWELRWSSTRRRTRMILGHEPDDVSAAKATLTIPVECL